MASTYEEAERTLEAWLRTALVRSTSDYYDILENANSPVSDEGVTVDELMKELDLD